MGLRELILAGCALLPAGCAALQSERVCSYKAALPTEHVVNYAIDHIINGEYTKAQGLLEQRFKHLEDEFRKELETNPKAEFTGLSASEQTLKAIAYAHTRNYDLSEKQFREVMGKFRRNPLIIEEVRKNLERYFTDNSFEQSEKKLVFGTIFYPELTAVIGFLKFANRDYENARKSFKKAIPNFEEKTVQEYREAFRKLLLHGCEHQHPDVVEYALTLSELYSVKGK